MTFFEVAERKGLKFNGDKSKVVVSGGEEGLVCKVFVTETQLQHVLEFKY